MSNINTVLNHLNTVGTISIREAMDEYSLSGGALTKAISVLKREQKLPIVRTMKRNPITGRRYARYHLEKVA